MNTPARPRPPGSAPGRGQVRVGVSGWSYAAWRGVFYPTGLPHRRELAYASRRMNSIELNASFYALRRPSSYLDWYAQTPPGFVFAVKGPRFVTHLKKLVDVASPLANFFASGPLALADKLGPVLWQLPPSLGFDPDRLAAFFALLPRTHAEAATLACRHEERLGDRAWTTVDPALAERPLRHVLEVRHDSFVTPALAPLLRTHDVGLVVADTAGRWPMLLEVTSSLVYVRLHGSEELYVSGYDDAKLEAWAARCAAWRDAGLDVFVYFDNDAKARAPVDAMALASRLGTAPVPEINADRRAGR